MNNQNRKQISKWVETIGEIKSKMEDMRDEEQEKYDNLPEGIQDSERGEAMQTAVDQLDYSIDNLQDAIDNLEEIQ